jgi:hypothetical protein
MAKGKKLSADDLLEFRLRKAALDHARGMFLMIEEAFNAWAKTVRDKYDLPPKFTVHPATGAVTASKDSTHG